MVQCGIRDVAEGMVSSHVQGLEVRSSGGTSVLSPVVCTNGVGGEPKRRLLKSNRNKRKTAL